MTTTPATGHDAPADQHDHDDEHDRGLAYDLATLAARRGSAAKTSISTDNVFRDGYSHQIANVTGSVASGYTARLTMAVA